MEGSLMEELASFSICYTFSDEVSELRIFLRLKYTEYELTQRVSHENERYITLQKTKHRKNKMADECIDFYYLD